MSKNSVNIEVSEELVKPVIEQEIHAAIVKQLGNKADLLRNIVAELLSTKVDNDGRQGKYDSRTPLLEFLSRKAVTECAKSAVDEWVESKRPDIQKEIERQLDKQKSIVAKSLVDGFAESVKNQYRMYFKIELKDRD